MVKNHLLQPLNRRTPDFLRERLARIKPAMQKFIERKWLPSAVMLIAREGKVVYHEAAGHQDCEKKTPAKKDSIFRLYSNSKAITGLATMILYEDGKLTWTTRFPNISPPLKTRKSSRRRGKSPPTGAVWGRCSPPSPPGAK